eukprot:15351553-Ditylum_brightwellii.AAC.1
MEDRLVDALLNLDRKKQDLSEVDAALTEFEINMYFCRGSKTRAWDQKINDADEPAANRLRNIENADSNQPSFNMVNQYADV